MAERYDPAAIEEKWQKNWEEARCFEAKDDYSMPKYYALIEFPYPSGEGLHVGPSPFKHGARYNSKEKADGGL